MQSNCANPGNDLLHLTFGYGTATANNGNPVSQTIVASGYTLTQNYGYDPVNRLKIAVEGAAVPGSMTCPVTTSWCQGLGSLRNSPPGVSLARQMHENSRGEYGEHGQT